LFRKAFVPRILVVDNETDLLKNLRTAVRSSTRIGDETEVLGATSATAAIALMQRSAFDVVVTDLNMDGHDAGLRVLTEARNIDPFTQVILITGYGSHHINEQMMELGAFDYLDRSAPAVDVDYMVRKKVELALKYRELLLTQSHWKGAVIGSDESSPLFLNALLPDHPGNSPAIPLGIPVTLRVNVGPLMSTCLTAEVASTSSLEQLHLFYNIPSIDVLVICAGASIDRSRKKLILPPSPKANVDFEVTALRSGSIRLTVSLLLNNEVLHVAYYHISAQGAVPTEVTRDIASMR
jgi:CheY-like chemotaxis protein